MRLLSNKQFDQLLHNSAQQENLERIIFQLQKRVDELQTDLKIERERANRAVDAQLAVRGFPTVTPPTSIPDFPDVLEEDPEAVAKVEARMQQGDATVFAERF